MPIHKGITTIFLDSLMLKPGREYNLNNIKLIQATDDFMNLDNAIKKCHAEHYDNCTTRNYVERVIQECGCLPLNIITTTTFEKVIDISSLFFCFVYFQTSICGKSKLECAKNIPIEDGTCLKGCQGLYVTSYFERELDKASHADFWSQVEKGYDSYKAKASVNFPEEMRSYEWKDSYKVIGIYIDTPAFDLVTKDITATFTDRLSTVGGTFGLLTGFSLISGVEILYFLTKFLISLFRRQVHLISS